MEMWKPKSLKQYPHFDAPLSMADAIALVNNPTLVASNPFFPFLIYEKKWRPFRKKGVLVKPKVRPIRYAARRDAYIFGRYRATLAERYEALITEMGISSSILAYRHIPTSPGASSGKCNIHFAKDAFQKIVAHDACTAIALDVSSFFESLDHSRIYKGWCELLATRRLPPDHFAVFKAITNYRVVDRKKAYERLNFFGWKKLESGARVKGYLVPKDQIPKRLCTMRDFRSKICGDGSNLPSLIVENTESFGIPQGSPISDIIANFYLLEFDVAMAKRAADLGGHYMRYSDDILLIIPGDLPTALKLKDEASALMRTQGPHMAIKEKKTCIVRYESLDEGQLATLIQGRQKNGLEYLGFRFDGKRIYIRDATMSGLYRKISRGARIEVAKIVSRFPGKDLDYLIEHFDWAEFTSRYGRVRQFDKNPNVRNWTFWTYAKRSAEILGDLGKPILRQVRNHKAQIRKRVTWRLERALAKSAP